jgi:hypothetical protein
MQQHVRIAVTHQVAVVWHLDAADAQRATQLGAMRILTQSNPQILARVGFSVGWRQASSRLFGHVARNYTEV